MFYFEILEGLYREKIRYLIVGGLAVNLHGVPRTTQDIDLIISTDPQNVENITALLDRLGYRPRLPVNPRDIAKTEVRRDWIENRNLKAFSFFHEKISYKVVDIVLDQPINFDDAFSRKLIVNVNDIKINVISLNDLILMKKSAGRPRDMSDVRMLKEALKIQGKI